MIGFRKSNEIFSKIVDYFWACNLGEGLAECSSKFLLAFVLTQKANTKIRNVH